MKKHYVLTLILVVFTLILVGCSSTSDTPTEENDGSEIVLTVDQLKEYNGKDGKPAYISVDGVIYDVTEVEFWAGGEHNGFSAGNDLTEEIKNVSPHGVSKLDGLPVVGRLSK